MGAHRLERLQEEIRHTLGSLFLRDLTDPDLRGLTLTCVKVTRDLGIARIYYEGGKSREAAQLGLQRARGFIRRHLASSLRLRVVPELEFFPDETAAEASRVEVLFEKIRQE